MSSERPADSEVAIKPGPITIVTILALVLIEAFLLTAGQTLL